MFPEFLLSVIRFRLLKIFIFSSRNKLTQCFLCFTLCFSRNFCSSLKGEIPEKKIKLFTIFHLALLHIILNQNLMQISFLRTVGNKISKF